MSQGNQPTLGFRAWVHALSYVRPLLVISTKFYACIRMRVIGLECEFGFMYEDVEQF